MKVENWFPSLSSDQAQFNNPSGNYTSSNFGVVTSAKDPRIGQLFRELFMVVFSDQQNRYAEIDRLQPQ